MICFLGKIQGTVLQEIIIITAPLEHLVCWPCVLSSQINAVLCNFLSCCNLFTFRNIFGLVFVFMERSRTFLSSGVRASM